MDVRRPDTSAVATAGRCRSGQARAAAGSAEIEATAARPEVAAAALRASLGTIRNRRRASTMSPRFGRPADNEHHKRRTFVGRQAFEKMK
jgi:hypothetical protein